MRKWNIGFSLSICILLVTGCGNSVDTAESSTVEESASAMSVESTASDDNIAEVKEDETSVESDTEEDSSNKMGPEVGLYDRTYLEESAGVYTYRLSDESVIEKYDELYLDAFKDMIDSYNEVMEWQSQSFSSDDEIAVSNLVLKETEKSNIIRVGSYYEMDYNFDLNNVGYTYVDLDSDGTFELIFGVLKDVDIEWIPKDYFERAYALVDGRPVKFCEGGSRDLHWLGSDGFIYETGSGGAAYWGHSRLHFDITEVIVDEELDWGNNGFVEDEFLGYLVSPVHIDGSSAGIEDASQVPEYQISEEDCEVLSKEWESRQVKIEWLKMSDYIEKYPLLGI